MRTSCEHLTSLCTPNGLLRLSRAAESVFASTNRPVIGMGAESVPKCLHPECLFPSSRDVHVCVHCVYMSCLSTDSAGKSASADVPELQNQSEKRSTHLHAHSRASGHLVYLSVEHGHLYCVECDDFVFNRFLDGAIALQWRLAQAHRRRFTSSISPLDAPVQRHLANEHSLARNRGKRRRLLTSAEWTPSTSELGMIAQHALLFTPPKSRVRPPVGLFNLGNSCYMNSVLQAFMNAPPLRNFFLADEHRHYCKKEPKSDCLACAMDRLVCDSCFSSEGHPTKEKNGSAAPLQVPFLVPQTVLDIIWRNAEHLATYAQHDAHEFLIAALNVLNAHSRREKTNEVRKKEKTEAIVVDAKTKWEGAPGGRLSPEPRTRFTSISPISNVRADPGGEFLDFLSGHSTTSIIQNLFSGTLQSDVICRVCGNSSPTLERFYDISLDVDKFVKPASTRRSRAQSPAGDNSIGEGTSGSGSHPRAVAYTSGEDRTNVRHKEESRGGTPDGSFSLNKASPDAANGNWEGDGDKDVEAANTLQECLSRFTEPELLGSSSKMYCIRCKTRQEAMKQMSIRTLPPIVCFHFKRFETSFANIRRSEMVKIDTPVEFPADGMDLSSFQTSAVLQRRHNTESKAEATTVETALVAAMQRKLRNGERQLCEETRFTVRDSKEAIYDLFAVVNHNGRIDSGHYTAMIRKKGEWFRCDDEKVTPMSTVGRVIRSEEAYLVFYVQRYPHMQF